MSHVTCEAISDSATIISKFNNSLMKIATSLNAPRKDNNYVNMLDII